MRHNKIEFTSIKSTVPGKLAEILERSYAELIESEPEIWESERLNWEQFDREVFEDQENADGYIFLTVWNGEIVGFAAYFDNPEAGKAVIGHNCILPEYRGCGLGKMQIEEILRRLTQSGFRTVNVITNDHPFFSPAQNMYLSSGFEEVSRYPWEIDPSQNLIEYQLLLESVDK